MEADLASIEYDVQRTSLEDGMIKILSGLFSLNLDFNLVEHESKLIFCVTYFVYFI